MFAKLYGRMKDQESLKSILDDLQDDLHKVGSVVSAEDRQLLEEHATFVREMEQELEGPASSQDVGHAVPELEPGVKHENDNMPQISKMQIDLMVNSFAADFARVATLQYHQFGRRGPDALARRHRGPPRAVAPPGQRQEVAGEADQDQQVVLRADGLPGQAAGRDARAGRRRQPARQHARSSGPTSWARATRTRLNDIPFVLVGNGLDFKMGRSLKYKKVPHNRLLLALANGMGHHIEKFGNPNFCGGGVLTGLT